MLQCYFNHAFFTYRTLIIINNLTFLLLREKQLLSKLNDWIRRFRVFCRLIFERATNSRQEWRRTFYSSVASRYSVLSRNRSFQPHHLPPAPPKRPRPFPTVWNSTGMRRTWTSIIIQGPPVRAWRRSIVRRQSPDNRTGWRSNGGNISSNSTARTSWCTVCCARVMSPCAVPRCGMIIVTPWVWVPIRYTRGPPHGTRQGSCATRRAVTSPSSIPSPRNT